MISFVVDANFVELHSVPLHFVVFFRARRAGRILVAAHLFLLEFFLLILPAYLLLVTCRCIVQ
jgi:hypothetical protein